MMSEPNQKYKIKSTVVKFSDIYDEHPQLGLYVPLYQREYCWDRRQYVRFFNDIVEVMNRKQSGDKIPYYYHFFGSTIYYNDPEKDQVHPKTDSNPSTVYNIVDGQQRLTSIALIATTLYKFFSRKTNLLEIYGHENTYGNNQTEKDSHQYERITFNRNSKWGQLGSELIKMLENYYSVEISKLKSTVPKIIRAGKDQWKSNDPDGYNSPVAKYLSWFINTRGGGEIPTWKNK